MENQKYTTIREIISRISLQAPGKADSYSFDNYVDWCGICEVDYIKQSQYFVDYTAVKVEIDNQGRGLLPCHINRLKDVCVDEDMRKRISYNHDGRIIRISERHDAIYLNFNTYPMCEDGYPLILKGHEEACVAFCMVKMYYSDFLDGKLDITRWNYLNQELSDQLKTTFDYRHVSRNDTFRQTQQLADMTPSVIEKPTNLN